MILNWSQKSCKINWCCNLSHIQMSVKHRLAYREGARIKSFWTYVTEKHIVANKYTVFIKFYKLKQMFMNNKVFKHSPSSKRINNEHFNPTYHIISLINLNCLNSDLYEYTCFKAKHISFLYINLWFLKVNIKLKKKQFKIKCQP